MYAKNYSPSAEKEDGTCEYYTKGNVVKIELASYPEVDLNGASWDANSYPDIFLRCTDSADVVKYQTPEITNVNSSISWKFPSNIGFSKQEGAVFFKIYEADDFTVESMGIISVNFDAYMHEANNELEKYPDSIVVLKDEIDLRIFVDWTE